VHDHSAMDSIFTMLNCLFQDPWTTLYEEALHEYMEDTTCSILGTLELVTTWHQIHLGLLAMIHTLEQAAGDCLQTSNPQVLASLHRAYPTLHLSIILDHYIQTFNLAMDPAAETVAAWSSAHPIAWSDSHLQGTCPSMDHTPSVTR